MNDRHDQSISTVLTALRQAEPDEAMQGRILAALREAEHGRTGRTSARRRPHKAAFAGPYLPWLAAAALLLVAGGTLLLHRQDQGTASRNQRAARAGVSTHPPARGAGHEQALQAGDSRNAAPSHDLPGAEQRVPHVSQERGPTWSASLSHLSNARPYNKLRAGDGATAGVGGERSFPAPPLRLTEQEQLLLQMARREPPAQLAHLSQAESDAAFQRSRDAVTEFFAPPPPLRGQQEPLPDPSQTGQP